MSEQLTPVSSPELSADQQPELILWEGLDAAAPDKMSWIAGRNAYLESQAHGDSISRSYENALDAAAPDSKTWLSGMDAITRMTYINDGTTTAEEAEPVHEASPRQEMIRVAVGAKEQMASYHDASEDFLLNDAKHNIYGVFDGMGGEGGDPAAAARVAGEAVQWSLSDPDTQTYANKSELTKGMVAAFEEVRHAVLERGYGGGAVGTAIRLCRIDGEIVMGVAHAGDTRLFKYSSDDETYEALTTDQSNGNIVHNGFHYSSEGSSKDEYIVHTLREGDRLMLCSDGITGDWGPDNNRGIPNQFLSEQEFLEGFQQPTPEAAAQRFFELSKKDDDKSVLVIDVM